MAELIRTAWRRPADSRGLEEGRSDAEPESGHAAGRLGVEDRARRRAARPEELRLLEALLFAAAEPLDEKDAGGAAAGGRRRARRRCAQLQAEYAPRGVNLVRIAGKWTFRTANDLVLAAHAGGGRAAQAVARRDRDAGRSSPITSR